MRICGFKVRFWNFIGWRKKKVCLWSFVLLEEIEKELNRFCWIIEREGVYIIFVLLGREGLILVKFRGYLGLLLFFVCIDF